MTIFLLKSIKLLTRYTKTNNYSIQLIKKRNHPFHAQ